MIYKKQTGVGLYLTEIKKYLQLYLIYQLFMKNLTLVFSFLLLLGLLSNSSCGANKMKADAVNSTEVPYQEAKNYFVKNTYGEEENANLKIETQELFDKIFGPAPVMGEGGKPTAIDFAKQYVVAYIRLVKYEYKFQ